MKRRERGPAFVPRFGDVDDGLSEGAAWQGFAVLE